MIDGHLRRVLSHPAFKAFVAVLSLCCAAPGGCGGGSPGYVSPSNLAVNLTETDVNTIVLQAQHEATARGAPATIVVVDRVGNVLAADQMPGAPTMATITSGRGLPSTQGLEGVSADTRLEALAKALDAAYFSSNNNAFSSRTANQIIQEHFNPGIAGNPSGPLFGVQFSQLGCSDVSRPAAPPGMTNAGPHSSAIGFAADSGGLPLYKAGVLVGAIGVMTKTTYSLNTNIFATPIDNDEVIALAGTTGYVAPEQIQADNIAINGNTLQFTDATVANLAAPVEAVGTFTPSPFPPYYNGPAPGSTATAGTVYGTAASGFAPDGTLGAPLYTGATAQVFVYDDGAAVRFPPIASLNPPPPVGMTQAEVEELVVSGLNIAAETRSAIRVPTNLPAAMTVTVVDLDGNILASARSADTLVDSADVTPQKARSAAFFSRSDAPYTAASELDADPQPASTPSKTFAEYITDARAFFSEPTAFANGIAWSTTALGQVSRPFYPDGIDGDPQGPLSLAFSGWSIFSTGVQLDLVRKDIATDIALGTITDAGLHNGCAGPATGGLLLTTSAPTKTQLANGEESFFGAVPIYRGSTVIGAISGSGDGGQQDDLIPYLGLLNGPQTINNAPASIRADQLTPPGNGVPGGPAGPNLRYVDCPAAPFLNSPVQNPC
jgi:uncharacterized protein GlcG (DUF336 family)